ncbi:MAG: hypothetical protein LBV28_03280 [Puniceicoccales bacterium]|jgi:DNA polymerase|nr:hypothetical protein [Puniceicoccales bacterium]
MLRDFLELMGEGLVEMKREGVSRLSVDAAGLDALRRAIGAVASVPSPSPAVGAVASPVPSVPLTQSVPLVSQPRFVAAPAGAVEPIGAVAAAVAKPTAPAFAIAPLPPPPQLSVPSGDKVSQLAWLRERVLTCPVCNAHKHAGKQLVFGVGDPDAEIFFCGEGPGADEEKQGEPFVGPAGELLTKIIGAMGLPREKVYIGNIMKWRPEMPTAYGNRPPTPDEMAFCLPFLRAQLAIVRPKVIVALGATAVEGLLGPDPTRTIGRIHGRWQTFEGTPLMPTYHPSYLLRSNTKSSKRLVWEDMLLVMERIGLPISERQRGYFL